MEDKNTKEADFTKSSNSTSTKGLKKWLKRFGVIGFWFFFIKGLVWIGVAVGAYYGFKLF
ncbi:MAG TPA: hypothetical protein VLZ83_05995 [Edaphocola sp.]|nr:hypothetical protein [Edaphocola sp.]